MNFEISSHELILLPYFIATDFLLPAWAYVGGNIH